MTLSETILPALLLTPLGAAALLLAHGALRPQPERAEKTPLAVQVLAAIGFLPPALYAAAFCLLFPLHADPATGHAWSVSLPLGIPGVAMLTLGLNAVSLPLFLLAALAGAAAGMHAAAAPVASKPAYLALLLCVFTGALGMFASADILFAYFFHETALIPAFLLILYWGGQGRRTAAIQMAVYLTLGAMVLLAALILIARHAGTTSIAGILAAFTAKPPAPALARWMSGLLLLGTAIPVGLFPFHSWAPPAYAEAPTPLAMLHAGVLKKFGLYLLLLLLPALGAAAFAPWNDLLYWLALGNILLLGLATLGQRHLKEMLSISSVAHMGICYLAIYAIVAAAAGNAAAADASVTAATATLAAKLGMTAATAGGNGAAGALLLYMVGHGLAAAALFLLSHAVHRRSGTLDFGATGGLAKPFPVLAAFFTAAAMASIGLPGFLNFWGELGIYASLGALPAWKLLLALSGLILAAVYTLRAVSRFFHGTENLPTPRATEPASPAPPRRDLLPAERLSALLLLLALLLFGFVPGLLTF